MQPRIFVILPLLAILFSSIIVPYSFASVESEAQEDIQAGCRDGQTMVFRYSYHEYVCVTPDTADRWRELGLAKIISESREIIEKETPVYNTAKNSEFPGAPPEPPKSPKKSSSQDNSECREGYTLVYRFIHKDTFCTSPSTASSWEHLGLAEIISSNEEQSETSNEEQSETSNEEQSETSNEEQSETSNEEQSETSNEEQSETSNEEQSETSNEEQSETSNEEQSETSNEEQSETSNEEQSETSNEEQSETSNEEQSETSNEEQSETSDSLSDSNLNNQFDFPPKIHQLNDRIWIGVGYDSTNTVLIEGEKGIIVIDSLDSYDSVISLLDDFKFISDKPIKTIIFTKITHELVSAADAFIEYGDGSVEIIVHEELLQFYNDVYNMDFQATHTYSSEFSLNISGVKMNLYRIEGESSDQTYIVLPDDDGILIGDSVYGSFPFILDLNYLQNNFN